MCGGVGGCPGVDDVTADPPADAPDAPEAADGARPGNGEDIRSLGLKGAKNRPK